MNKSMSEPRLKRNVYLVDWTPNWGTKFETEKRRLQSLLGPVCLDIHHIDSTYVEGIKAKPIVDILVIVRSHQELDHLSPMLVENGYEVKGENGITDRRYFQKNEKDERVFHIHAFELGNAGISSHLRFRDILRAYPGIAREYENTKLALAEKYGLNKPAYCEAKSPFIQKVLNCTYELDQ